MSHTEKLLSLILIQPDLDMDVAQIEHYSVLDLNNPLLSQAETLRNAGTNLEMRMQIRDPNYGLFETEKDMYGGKFFYVSPHQMAFSMSESGLLSEWDDSIMKFLSSLNPTIKVVPWWH